MSFRKSRGLGSGTAGVPVSKSIIENAGVVFLGTLEALGPEFTDEDEDGTLLEFDPNETAEKSRRRAGSCDLIGSWTFGWNVGCCWTFCGDCVASGLVVICVVLFLISCGFFSFL